MLGGASLQGMKDILKNNKNLIKSRKGEYFKRKNVISEHHKKGYNRKYKESDTTISNQDFSIIGKKVVRQQRERQLIIGIVTIIITGILFYFILQFL